MMTSRTMNIKTLLSAGLISAAVAFSSVPAQAVVDADARMRTIVYNENEVFRVIARNGFQTHIELANNETIDTLSIGDSIGWQITPASHRIFVKPLQKTGMTNLTVITNRRTYQFELVASNPVSSKHDHAYLVKFYYPEANATDAPIDRTRDSLRPVNPSVIPQIPTADTFVPPTSTPTTPPVMPGDSLAAATQGTPQTPAAVPATPAAPMTPPVMPGEVVAAAPIPATALSAEGYNFNYTLTGPDSLAPTKIYDDGKSTFFQFATPASPAYNYSVVNADGSETPVPSRLDSDGKVIIDRVAAKMTIREGANLVCVFNEQASLPAPATLPDPSSLVVPPARP